MTVTELAAKIQAGHELSIARGLTLIENYQKEGEALLRLLFASSGQALVIGVTGPPGSGKSTLVDRLANHWASQGQSTAVIAVDPSSPFTGGAILGDRIRMRQAASLSGVFIRSMSARGSLGGLAARTAEAITLLDAAGYQRIIIETVGVGQSEVDVAALASIVLLIHVPGLGDDIQTIKAGLMEIGDIHVINKSDLPGADRLKAQLEAMLSMDCQIGAVPLLSVTAATNQGVESLVEAVEGFLDDNRRVARQAQWSQRQLELALQDKLRVLAASLPEDVLEAGLARIRLREAAPGEVAEEFVKLLLASGTK